jgi:threonine/homoserine/homoserine lactone efflux protein
VQITPRRVYVTTLLNPKALVVGFILVPAPMAEDFLSKLCLFFLTVPLIAAGWFGAGRMAGRTGSPARMLAIQRLASVCLTVLSGTLFVAAVGCDQSVIRV